MHGLQTRVRWGEQFCQFGLNAFNQRWPGLAGGFAEEAHGGVPGAVGAIEEPAPVGGVGEEGPDGSADGAGEVGESGIGGNNQVELLDEGRGVGEVADGGGVID